MRGGNTIGLRKMTLVFMVLTDKEIWNNWAVKIVILVGISVNGGFKDV